MDSNSLLEYNVDKTQVPAIDQKRIVAFINHFVVKTVTFLNQFAVNCETKFVDFESKLQQIESSLLILESKVTIYSSCRLVALCCILYLLHSTLFAAAIHSGSGPIVCTDSLHQLGSGRNITIRWHGRGR